MPSLGTLWRSIQESQSLGMLGSSGLCTGLLG